MLLSAAHALLAQFGGRENLHQPEQLQVTKWEVYNAIEGMGGRATWAQLEERFDNQSRFSLCLSRLVRDGLLRAERTCCKGRIRYYVIAAPYPERNVWMPDKAVIMIMMMIIIATAA